MHYNKDFGIECRIARFHNIYGPYGTWKGGREKAPAAFCRKVGINKKSHKSAAELILVALYQRSALTYCPSFLRC